MQILSPDITSEDTRTSSANLHLLLPYIKGTDRSLVFFVGAGASAAGSTNLPTSATLLRNLLMECLNATGHLGSKHDFEKVIEGISDKIGFEITLNDFWQICRDATALIFDALADYEEDCEPNAVHTFMSRWLISGGTVLTTNYDRLIERAWKREIPKTSVIYKMTGRYSFSNWQSSIHQGGTLFKLHGSLDDPSSCLGALEHVTTQISGHRANLLEEIVRTRPLCFVGWSGVDPDIPPLFESLLSSRDPALPSFWIHYEGSSPGNKTIEDAIERTSPAIVKYASDKPILTDANRAFNQLSSLLSQTSSPQLPSSASKLDLSKSVRTCSLSALARFVGIILRRSGCLKEAEILLNSALALHPSPEEESAVIQEILLLNREQKAAKSSLPLKMLSDARKSLGKKPDIHLLLNIDFGKLSMTVSDLSTKPLTILRVPKLFLAYKKDIERLRKKSIDPESVALHEALLNLYCGRVRLHLLGWLRFFGPIAGRLILPPFNSARILIESAKDVHIHSKIDILSYRSIALSRLGYCKEATQDITEIDRLIVIFKDEAREKFWRDQKSEIEQSCASNL
jgi:hypothetical protein